MEKCVAARDHIKAFLTEENKEEEEKKVKERPKVRVVMNEESEMR